ncbi:MAG: hypothetical protein EOO65_05075, partial [Methanosarcinales archaeon]
MLQIRALKNDTRYANLYELVTIFASGDIKDYVTFYEKNKAYVDHIGVNHVESLETMRLLTLCSMAAAKSQRTLAELAEGLQVCFGCRSVAHVCGGKLLCLAKDQRRQGLQL